MVFFTTSVPSQSRLLDVPSLKQLLAALATNGHAVGVRFRVTGQLWMSNFAKVVSVSGNTVVLRDEATAGTIVLFNLPLVVEFELDQVYRSFQPYVFYGIAPYLN